MVQLENELDLPFEDSEDIVDLHESEEEETVLLDRPDIAEYDDDW